MMNAWQRLFLTAPSNQAAFRRKARDPPEIVSHGSGSIERNSHSASPSEPPQILSAEIEDSREDDYARHVNLTRANASPNRLYQRSRALWSQLTLSEVSGSFGDLGTFIPLFTALARQRSIYVAPALFMAGLSNVVTGYAWDLPMPVQPMKSIAAVAIAEVLTREQVTTAGLCMGIMLILLGWSNAIEWVNKIVPASVVSGMQLGVGLSLAIHGLHMVADLNWIDQPDCIVLAVLCSLACLYLLREDSEPSDGVETRNQQSALLRFCSRARPPVGLSLFLLGSVLAVFKLLTTNSSSPSATFGGSPIVWALGSLTWEDWKIGILEGALPQLPLSTLNSVISVCCLAQTLYPEKRQGDLDTDAVLSRREVSLSVGWMNLLLCPFGAMPNCHGAGGLAGQHRLGARHGASVVFLGLNKMVLAVFLGGHILSFLDAIPAAILGVMLVISGHELACTGFTLLVRSSQSENETEFAKRLKTNTAVTVITAAVIVGLKKTHLGALSGWAVHMIYGYGIAECRRTKPVISYSHVSSDEQPEHVVEETKAFV